MDISNLQTAYTVKQTDQADRVPKSSSSNPSPVNPSSVNPWGDDGFTFFDFLDIINPLQHIPVVSTLYREFSGDEIAPAARIAGSTLFGGPVGFGFSLVNTAIESETGKDIGGHVMALLKADTPSTQVANSAPSFSGTSQVSDWARQELEFRRQATLPTTTAAVQAPVLSAYERAALLGLSHSG